MKALNALVSDNVGSWIRTALAGVGGFLVARGYADPETIETITNNLVEAGTQIAAGAVMFLTAQIASLINKQNK